MLNEPTQTKLQEMRLSAMAEAWHEQQRNPDFNSLDFDERFALLVDAEYLHRHNRRLARRLKEAHLRQSQACIEGFESAAQRGIDKSLLKKLASCAWMQEHLNVLITGPTGVGKTYLACALGHNACRKGFRVLYRRASRLIDELALARADGSLPRLLTRVPKSDIQHNDGCAKEEQQ